MAKNKPPAGMPFPGLTENPNQYTLIPLLPVEHLVRNRLLKLLWKLGIAYKFHARSK
jgi:hypothetical protein